MKSACRTCEREEALTLALPSQRSSAFRMRARLRAYLSEHQVAAAPARDLVLAAEEALTNAIMHAGDAQGSILFVACVNDGEVSVEVRDLGRGFDTRRIDPSHRPDGERDSGRGLFLIHRVMDRVEIRSGGRGTTVRMVRHTA